MRLARKLVVPIVVVILSWIAFAAVCLWQSVDTPFRLYGTDQTSRQAPGEGTFFFALAVFGTLAAAAIAGGAHRALGPRLERALEWAVARRRLVVGMLAVAAAVAATCIGTFSFWHQNFTDDEYAYLFTAKLLRHGHISAPMLFPIEAFHYQFLTYSKMRTFALYGVVHPAILLPGLFVGVPQLGVHLLVGVIVIATAGLGRELYGDRASVLAALVCATSPFLLATGATMHNAVTATALLGVFLWCFVRHEARLRPADAFVAGLALALALHVRTLDALAIGAPAGLYALWRLVRGPERKHRLFGYFVMASCVFCGVAFYLLLNAELTGNWLRTPYDVFNQRWPNARMFGFGKGPMKYFNNTPEIAFSKALVQVLRGHFWMFGWPLGILPVLAARGRRAAFLGVLALAVVGAYFFYFANAVFDTGPVYYLSTLPVLAVLAVRGLDGLRDRIGGAAPIAALVGLTAAGGIFFFPREFMAAREVARIVRRPKRVVERAGLHHAVVMAQGVMPKGPPPKSWVFFTPIPGIPLEDEDVIWVADVGPTRQQSLFDRFPGRRIYRMRWVREEPVLEPADREP